MVVAAALYVRSTLVTVVVSMFPVVAGVDTNVAVAAIPVVPWLTPTIDPVNVPDAPAVRMVYMMMTTNGMAVPVVAEVIVHVAVEASDVDPRVPARAVKVEALPADAVHVPNTVKRTDPPACSNPTGTTSGVLMMVSVVLIAADAAVVDDCSPGIHIFVPLL